MSKQGNIRMLSKPTLPDGYTALLCSLKDRIRKVRASVVFSAQRALVVLYWEIGRTICEKQGQAGWGAKVIDHLAADLSREFPAVQGLSRANLYRMRAFYLAYPSKDKDVARLVRQIPWGHNLVLLEKLSDNRERLWYATKVVEDGWGRDTLISRIKSGVVHRRGKALTNFRKTRPSPQSALAQEALKDPYVFDFLTLTDPVREKEMENQLVGPVARLLLEMGAGFAFVGRQVPIVVSGNTYFLDILLYHMQLHAYVVVELKAGEFKPEFAGKLNFYLSAVDDLIRKKGDHPTIGLLLCRSRDKIDVGYAFRDIQKPMGIAERETTLVRHLPADLRPSLPTVREIEGVLTRAQQSGQLTVDDQGDSASGGSHAG